MTATNKESMNKPSTLIDKCEKNEVVQLREANVEDAKVLHKLICKSTKTQLIITVQQLEADLRKIDTNGLETNTSFIRCLLAESGNNIIGYLMFYYYYTPWIGHSLYVADVFVKPDFRKQGVATRLFKKLQHISQLDKFDGFIFNFDLDRLDEEQKKTISKVLKKPGFKPYRVDDSDWSIFKFFL